MRVMARKSNPKPKIVTPAEVQQALNVLGTEQGDYGRAHGVIVRDKVKGTVCQVTLEGWGLDCIPGASTSKLRTASRQHAKSLKRRGWPQVGSMFTDASSGVAAITWGLNPLDVDTSLKLFDLDDIIDV